MFRRFNKPYRIAAGSFTEVVPCPLGHMGCVVSDRITVGGEPVGYMYRERTERPNDSGWAILAGTETEDELGDSEKAEVWTINEAANFDRRIASLVNAPVGAAFMTDPLTGNLVADPVGAPSTEVDQPQTSKENDSWPPPAFPLVEGRHAMTEDWCITLPERFARRIEDGSLVLWRPGLTIWIIVWNNDHGESVDARLAICRSATTDQQGSEQQSTKGDLTYWSRRGVTTTDRGHTNLLQASVLGLDSHVQMSVYFDNDHDVSVAHALVASVHRR